MEIVVSIIMGLIGAAATIYAAKIQATRKGEQDRASEAKFARKPPPSSSSQAENVGVLDAQQVFVTLIFPGSSSLQNEDGRGHETNWSYITVHLDGERVGSGNGASGFKIDFQTTVGMHDLVFMWEEETTKKKFGTTNTWPYRSEVEVVFTRPGACALRLAFDNYKFNVRRFEPKASGYVPLSVARSRSVLFAGIGTLVLSALALWFLFLRR